MKKYKHSKNSPDRTGFYVALSICLIAVGLAVWSAYSSFSDVLATDDDEYFSSLRTETIAAVAQEMTGVTARSTDAPTQSEPPTESLTQGRGSILLSESITEPSEEDEAVNAELSSLQAVLKVADSLTYPVKSRSVLKQFSETAVFNKTMGDYRTHTGCDFVADEGEPVYAMCEGVVKNISSSELYGIIVEVESSGFSVYYCGLSNDLNVDKGDELSTGDTIGTVGQIPCESADDSHIHVEIRVNQKLIDPLSVINSAD